MVCRSSHALRRSRCRVFLAFFLSLIPASLLHAAENAAESEARLRQTVTYLASDALEGRGVGTEGLNRAADYVAAQFAQMGLRTDLFNGTPFQEFEVAISAEILLLNLRAWQLREPLRLNPLERLITRGELSGWSVPVSVGIVSLILALILPAEQIQWSGWFYFSMIVLVPLHDYFHRRKLKAESCRSAAN